jgi:hypothetical protein
MRLEQLGFCFGEGGTHLARTMMFDDLVQVFDYCDGTPSRQDVLRVVDEDNCLGKPSGEAFAAAVRV